MTAFVRRACARGGGACRRPFLLRRRRAPARTFALSAAQVRGTASVLRDDARATLSPAIGLVTLHANALVGNLVRADFARDDGGAGDDGGLAQTGVLARDLFFQRDESEPPAATRSRSRVAYHLTPTRLGHLAGMATDGVARTADDIEAVLATLGVVGVKKRKSGRRVAVDGELTQISMVRFVRMFQLAAAAHRGAGAGAMSPAMPLLLRFLWQRASSKRDLLDFLLAAEQYRPVFRDDDGGGSAAALRHDADAQRAWCESEFSRDDLADTAPGGAVERAALQLLGGGGGGDAGRDLELVAAGLSSAHAFKPVVKLRRHTYNGADDRADCVEVVVREIVDLLIFDSQRNRLDGAGRLPPGASAAIRAFYDEHGGVRGDDDGEAEEFVRSKAWFEVCAGLPAPVEYTSASDGAQGDYELIPTVANVCRVLGTLLFGDAGFTNLDAFARAWEAAAVARGDGDGDGGTVRLRCAEHGRLYRAPGSEEATRRESGALGFDGGNHSIEFELEVLHNMAIVRHLRHDVAWAVQPREAALRQWLAGDGEPPLAAALRPALLSGDAMIAGFLERRNDERAPTRAQILEAWFQTRWGADRKSLSTLERTSLVSCAPGGHLFSTTAQEALAEDGRQVRRVVALLAARAESEQEEEQEGDDAADEVAFVTQLLRWAFAKLPEDGLSATASLELGRLLCRLHPAALAAAMPCEDGAKNALLFAIVRHGALGRGLARSIRDAGGGVVAVATLLGFRVAGGGQRGAGGRVVDGQTRN